MIQANFDALSYSQGAARCWHLNMTSFKRSDKRQHQTRPRFWCGEYLCKITKRYWQFLQSYHVHKAAWHWASLKVLKRHTKVNVEPVRDNYVENIQIKLQHDTSNLQRVIAFTRSSIWTWPSSKVWATYGGFQYSQVVFGLIKERVWGMLWFQLDTGYLTKWMEGFPYKYPRIVSNLGISRNFRSQV